MCRPAAGVCDVAEVCDGPGANCPPDGFASGATVCRPSAGVCDVAETCTGSGPACPADTFQSSATVCRAVGRRLRRGRELHRLERRLSHRRVPAELHGLPGVGRRLRRRRELHRLGSSLPGRRLRAEHHRLPRGRGRLRRRRELHRQQLRQLPGRRVSEHRRLPAGHRRRVRPRRELRRRRQRTVRPTAVAAASTVCRPSAGVCDVAETCDGARGACPADAKSTAVCRRPAGVCDVAESCDGVNDTCPADAFAAAHHGLPGFGRHLRHRRDLHRLEHHLPRRHRPARQRRRRRVRRQSTTATASPIPDQADADSDGLGDACDPCTNIVPTGQDKMKLTSPSSCSRPRDDKLSFKGFFTSVPHTPTIDPVTNGMRFLIVRQHGHDPDRHHHPRRRLQHHAPRWAGR